METDFSKEKAVTPSPVVNEEQARVSGHTDQLFRTLLTPTEHLEQPLGKLYREAPPIPGPVQKNSMTLDPTTPTAQVRQT